MVDGEWRMANGEFRIQHSPFTILHFHSSLLLRGHRVLTEGQNPPPSGARPLCDPWHAGCGSGPRRGSAMFERDGPLALAATRSPESKESFMKLRLPFALLALAFLVSACASSSNTVGGAVSF